MLAEKSIAIELNVKFKEQFAVVKQVIKNDV